MNYELKILDTTDAYILTFIGNGFNKDKVLPTYETLYNEIGVSITIVDTPHGMLSKDTVQFIMNTCGVVLPTTLPFANKQGVSIKDGRTVLDKLIQDITTIIEFNRIKSFWNTYANPNSNAPSKADDCTIGVTSAVVDTCDDSFSLNNDVGSSNLTDLFGVKLLPENYVRKSTKTQDKVIYILWNNTYSIAIIYEDINNVIPDISKNKGEWEIVHTLNSVSDDVIATCKSVFHKKTFDSMHALVKKVDCLKQLLGLDERVSGQSSMVHKDILLNYIRDNFEVTKDSSHKIRATDLYKNLCNNFRIDYTNESTFRKKVIGHLLELGVLKRRFSDGYYFCGITQKLS